MIQSLKSKFIESKFTYDTISLLISQIVVVISGLLVNLLLGTYFEPKFLAIFSQCMGLYMVSSTISSLGQNNTLVKFISQESEYKPDIISICLTSTIILSSLFTLLLYIFIGTFPGIFSSNDLAERFRIIILAIPFFNANKNIMFYLSGKREQKKFSFLKSIRWILLLLFVFLFSFFYHSFNAIFYSFVLIEICLLFFSMRYIHLSFNIPFNVFVNKAVEQVSFGIKSLVSEIFAVFNEYGDVIALGYFLTQSELGYYSFSMYFVKSMLILPRILAQNINPIISRLFFQGNISKLQLIINKVKFYNCIFIIIQFIGLLFIYKLIITFIAVKYINTFKYFIIAMIGILPLAFYAWSGSLLIMTGKLKENSIRTLIILIFNLVVICILTKYFGLNGSVISVGLTSLFGTILLNKFIEKSTGLKI